MLQTSSRVFCGLLALSCSGSTLRPDVKPEDTRPESAAVGTPAQAPLLLQAGEVAELRVGADGAAALRLATPIGNEQFVLIVGSNRFGSGRAKSFDYSLRRGEGESAGPSELVTGCSLPGAVGQAALSSSAASSSAAAGVSSSAASPSASSPVGPPPREGSSRTLFVPTSEGATQIAVRAVSVGPHAVVWADTTHPTTLDRDFAVQFREDFERVILPRARQVFGAEPDLDGNGSIQLVFSPLTHERSVAFFTGCDLYEIEGCLATNHGEYLYLTPPDAIDPPYNTPNAIKEILTHEVSHLIHFNRKVLRGGLSSWPDSIYMIEGVGALAQDVTGFQAGNLYVTQAGLQGIEQFSLADVLWEGRRHDAARDGVLRGVSYLFLRYLYDRGGGDGVAGLSVEDRGGPAFVRGLIDSPRSMATALGEITRRTSADIAMDFFTALAMSNREQDSGVAPLNPCFAYLPTVKDPITGKQRGADLFATFHGVQMSGPDVAPAPAPDGKVRAGGVQYLALDASSAARELSFTLWADPESTPRVRIGRWK
jgi:hypothetical protein